jgi:hypothetical protein
VQARHREISATFSRKVRTFSSANYLEGLMAELDRAAISIRMAQARDAAGPTQPEIAEGHQGVKPMLEAVGPITKSSK